MDAFRRLGLLAVVVGAVAVAAQPRIALASHNVHGNQWYWEEWAYTPLAPVKAYDCTTQTQPNAIAGAANEWNATGLVNVVTQTGAGACNETADGIVWRPNAGTAKSRVDYVFIDVQVGVLEPGTQPGAPVYKARKIDIYLGALLPDRDSTCAGYYSPCDVATHEMGHALGLQDHYSGGAVDACWLNPGGPSCFSYGPAGTTIMDYPHITNITPHDVGDLTLKYRNAPFSSYPFTASPANFYTVGLKWGDRSHNEDKVQLFERPYGGSPGYIAVFPRNS